MQITQITAATPEALAAVNALLPHLSERAQPITIERLSQITGSAGTYLFLATDEHDIVGMFTLNLTLLPTGPRMWLDDLVLSPDHRGKGLGRQLTEVAIAEARRISPTATLMLTSKPARIAANSIYATLFQHKDTNVYQLPLS
jgi:GNAT superfamily N-acetyltransferase